MQKEIKENIESYKKWIANLRKVAEEINEEWLTKIRAANTTIIQNVIPGITNFAMPAFAQDQILKVLRRFNSEDIIPGNANLAKHTQAQRDIQKILDDFEASVLAMEKQYGGEGKP